MEPIFHCSVKQSVQAMEICRRSTINLYDVKPNAKSVFTNIVPSSTANLTMSFGSQINSLQSQVRDRNLFRFGLKSCDRFASYS